MMNETGSAGVRNKPSRKDTATMPAIAKTCRIVDAVWTDLSGSDAGEEDGGDSQVFDCIGLGLPNGKHGRHRPCRGKQV